MLRKNFKTPNGTSQLIERGDFPPLINFWALFPLSVNNSNVRLILNVVRLRLNVVVGFVNEGKSEKFGINAFFYFFLFILWVVLNSFILLLFYPFVFSMVDVTPKQCTVSDFC